MNWELSTKNSVVAVATFMVGATLTIAPAAAQVVTGVLGSPMRRPRFHGNQLPPPPPEIRRRHQGNR